MNHLLGFVPTGGLLFNFEYRFFLVDVVIPVDLSFAYRVVAIHLDIDTNCVLVRITRMPPHRRAGTGDPEPPPPPSMAEVLMAIEVNRQHSERLLEQLVQQGARRDTECISMTFCGPSLPPLLLLRSLWMLMISCVPSSASLQRYMSRLLNK